MLVNIEGNSKRMNFMAKESVHGKMVLDMKVNGCNRRCMDKELFIIQTARSTKGSLKRIGNMAMGL